MDKNKDVYVLTTTKNGVCVLVAALHAFNHLVQDEDPHMGKLEAGDMGPRARKLEVGLLEMLLEAAEDQEKIKEVIMLKTTLKVLSKKYARE